jgi:hypothetical protein
MACAAQQGELALAHRAPRHSLALAHRASQLRELAIELTSARSTVVKAEEEVARLKALHSQVKGALQGAYSQNQDLNKQVGPGTRAKPRGCVRCRRGEKRPALSKQTGSCLVLCPHRRTPCWLVYSVP